MCERRDFTISRNLIFKNQNKLEWFSVPDSWEPHPDTCATHPPLKYPIPLLKEKMRWKDFETNLDMLGNKICRQLLGMQLKYHWWERLAREWEWEIDFSLQETNSSWQPHSEKQVGVLSIAPSKGSIWPPFSTWSATDTLHRGELEILLERKHRATHTSHAKFTDQAQLSSSKHSVGAVFWEQVSRADLRSEIMSALSQCFRGDTFELEVAKCT